MCKLIRQISNVGPLQLATLEPTYISHDRYKVVVLYFDKTSTRSAVHPAIYSNLYPKHTVF